MLQAVDLLLDLARDFGIRVPDAHRQDAAEKVEVPPSLAVPEILALSMVGDQRLGVIVDDAGENILLVFSQDFVAIHRHLGKSEVEDSRILKRGSGCQFLGAPWEREGGRARAGGISPRLRMRDGGLDEASPTR